MENCETEILIEKMQLQRGELLSGYGSDKERLSGWAALEVGKAFCPLH